MPPVDRFHDYLDYCELVEPISVGDYIEKVIPRNEVMAWTQLARDVLDTHRAGRLTRIQLDNGGAAYIRKLPTQTELPLASTQ